MTVSERFDKIVFVGMLVVLALAALTHGAVEAWSLALVELSIAALFLLRVLAIATAKRIVFELQVIVLPVAALLLLGTAQGIGITGSDGRRLSLSLDAEATRGTIQVLVFMLIFLWIAVNSLATLERLRSLGNFAGAYGLAMALYALLQHFTSDGRFYWLRPNSESISAFGPFVNHNHFAGYMNMLIFVPLALALSRSVRSELRLFHGFAVVIMGISVAASLSRGGAISLLAGAMFFLIGSFMLRRKEKIDGPGALPWSRVAAVGVIVIAMVAGGLWIAAGPVAERAIQTVEQARSSEALEALAGRSWIWKDTLRMISANPLLGVGLGAYETAYPAYSSNDGTLRVSEAHNDYLQAVADGGVTGALVVMWFLFLLSRSFTRGVSSSLLYRDPLLRTLALGTASSIFTMLIHSLFDFNLQLPSNALLFLTLSAALYQIGSQAAARAPGKTLRLQNAAPGGGV